MPETPEIGDKFKVRGKRGTFAFRGVGGKGDVVWWDFISIEDGKYHAFYPDEVRSADTPTKKRATKKESSPSKWYIPEGREPRVYNINGEQVTFL